MKRLVAVVAAVNGVVALGVLLAINEHLHPASVNDWIAWAGIVSFFTGIALGFGVGYVNRAREEGR